MSKVIYVTICSKNYLAYALTLGKSLLRAQPGSIFKIILADDWPYKDGGAPIEVPFDLIEARSLGLSTFDDMVIRYSIMEFNTAIKAAAILHLFEAEQCDSVVYLDPDIFVVSPLEELEQVLETGCNAVLTPHTCSPLEDGGDPDDVRLMRTGAYNLGFCAFNRSEESIAFLKWWARRLTTDCRIALDDGLFVDQKFMDLAPCYLSKTEILRNAGYNTAYWNLMSRPVTRTANGWLSGGVPLRFFHFSGVVPGDRKIFSKHQDRYDARDIGELRPLFDEYLDQIEANGHSRWRSEPYDFAALDGLKLDDFMRRLYQEAYPMPMRGVPPRADDILRLCQSTAGDDSGPVRLTRYQRAVWEARSDLRRVFDISRAAGKLAFLEWLVTSGVREHAIPSHLLPTDADLESARALLKPASAHVAPQPLTLRARLSRVILARLALVRPIYKRLPKSILEPVRNFVTRVAHQTRVAQTALVLPKDPGVAIYGYFHTESGVGEGARQAYAALAASSMPVEAHPLSTQGIFQDSVEFDAAEREPASSAKSVHLFHVNADRMSHIDEIAGRRLLHPRAHKIGYWAWELSNFPDAWAPAAELLDEIWTPSRFTQEAVARAVNKPCHVIPHPVEVPEPPTDAMRRSWRIGFGIEDGRFAVLSVFDFNSFIERKNPEAALEAYAVARKEVPELLLVLKTHGANRGSSAYTKFMARASETPGVILIDKVLSRGELSKLQWAADAFLSMHRAEGFGLNILEMMARSKPVVVTDYSGSKDFVDAEVGRPVRYRLIDVPERAYPFAAGQVWADPDPGHASEALVELARDRGLAEDLGTAARNRVKTQFSHAVVVRRMLARLGSV